MIKNAHKKYYLSFEGLGDFPAPNKMIKLLKAIKTAIRKRELTRENCDAEIVENMQRVLVNTLNGDGGFLDNLDIVFPPEFPSTIEVLPVLSSDKKSTVTDAEDKYYLRFRYLGDNPTTAQLLRLLHSIQDAIKKRQLTRENCDVHLVDRMQRVLKLTLENGGNFSFFRRLFDFFPDEFFNEEPNPNPNPISLEFDFNPIPEPKTKAKAKVKDAHMKYYLRLKELGDHSSKGELRSLLEAIQDAIRKGELTRENCNPEIVRLMQQALIYTLNGSSHLSFFRHLYFSSVDEKAKTKVKAKPKAEPKTKTKVKARAKKSIQLEPKQSPATNSTIERATIPAVPIQDAVVLNPNTELRCRVYDVSEKAKAFNTNTNVTTNSTTKRAKPSNRQGLKIRSAKSIAQQQYNFFNSGAFGEIFGEVAIPFSLMVSGVPGSGKTSFLLQLIKHVSKTYARHRLLFVSNEERFNPSLGTKLKRFEMLDCDNLDISDSLPSNLTDYDFIFFDSVQSLRLSVEDFKQQISQLTSAGGCLFFVFQATKSGSFRGSLEYEHEVDISLKVEGGRATVGKNRFGGSGYYQIF